VAHLTMLTAMPLHFFTHQLNLLNLKTYVDLINMAQHHQQQQQKQQQQIPWKH